MISGVDFRGSFRFFPTERTLVICAVMTPSRPKNGRLAVMVVGLCAIGLILMPLTQGRALASPDLHPVRRPADVNLRLDHNGATRVLSELEGAAQEADPDQPKSMEAQAAPKAAKKAPPPPEDKLAFLKDWPFWVIVGGVLVAGVGGYMLFSNANEKPACDMTTFTAGCFGSR